MLITPYLIGTDNNIILNCIIMNLKLKYVIRRNSYLVDYPEGNLLTKEIVDNFKPKAFVALNDITFYERVLNDYLKIFKGLYLKRKENQIVG